MTKHMHAAAIDSHGGPEVLRVRELPRPALAAPDSVAVRVLTAGVQPTDAAIRSGWPPPGASITFPQILGNEFAGVVTDTGLDVRGFAPGDAVLGFNVLECYAEHVVVPAAQLVGKPDGVAWTVAGALSASGQTAHTALEDLGVAAGETVLVHGAAGGVGTMFTQLARDRGATVIGTAAEENHAHLHALGAHPVAYGPGQVERIRAVAGRIDAAFDAAGHGNLTDAVVLVADRGRIGTIVDMGLADELGCRFLRSRRSAERLAELVELVDDGRLDVHIRRTYSLADAADAHRDVGRGHGRGKVVLEVGDVP